MKKILLIEDNLEMRENTSEILEVGDYEVLVAENGKIGVEVARKDFPDLILCDIMMPVMDGFGVLNELGRDTSTAYIPFIFLTAKADRNDFRKGMSLGADDYLTKPFEEHELLEAIDARLKRSSIMQKSFETSLDGLDAFFDEAKGEYALQQLSDGRELQDFKSKTMVFKEGDSPENLFFIVKGKIKITRCNSDGKELVTELYNQGEFFGFQSLLTEANYTQNATCLESCQLALIPKRDFKELMWRNKDVSHRFIRMLANNVDQKEMRLLHLAYNSVRARVAEVLLDLKDKYGKEQKGDFHIRITRDDLAAMAGTATESLIRTLSEFRNDGYIENAGREIIICDPTGLERVKRLF